MSSNDGPLSGVRVVELASFLAAPMLSMYLADFGAEVLKVERPGAGDEMRGWGHEKNGIGLYFKVINRNKKSITADLHTHIGQSIVKRLVSKADVVVENFRPGTLESWGLGYDALSAVNPKLILVRVSGYGQTGPYSKRGGFGTLAEGFTGYAHITGQADGPPLLPAFGLADSTTAINGAFLTAVALYARDTGRAPGQVIDLAIYEPLFTLLGPQVVTYDQLGIVQGRAGSRLPFTAPRNTFQTLDGKWVVLSGSAQSAFERICKALQSEWLVEDPRFIDNRSRLQYVEELDSEIQTAIGHLSLEDLLQRCNESGATIEVVNNVAEAVDHPQVVARENVVRVDDKDLGSIRMQNVVGKLTGTPGKITHAGPSLGEHNQEVLVNELGFSPEELSESGIHL